MLRFERHPLLEPLEDRRLLECHSPPEATLPCLNVTAQPDSVTSEGASGVFVMNLLYADGAPFVDFSATLDVLPYYPDDAFGLYAISNLGAEIDIGGEGQVTLSFTPEEYSWAVYLEAYVDSVSPELDNLVYIGVSPDGGYELNHGDAVVFVTIQDLVLEQSETEKVCDCPCECGGEGNNEPKAKKDENKGANRAEKKGSGEQSTQYASEANPHPIVTVRTLHPQFSGSVSRVAAALTLTKTTSPSVQVTQTEHFNVTGLTSGDPLSYGVQVDASSLGTGRYRWTMNFTYYNSGGQVVVPTSGTTSYSGYKHVVDFTASPLGNRWNFQELDRLHIQTSSNNFYYQGALLVHGDATSDWFSGSGVGFWQRDKGEPGFSTLEKLGNGTYRLIDKYGTTSIFTSAGLLDYRLDRNGTYTNFTYDGSNRVTQIATHLANLSDTTGRTTTFVYDANGYLDYVDDFVGRRTQYTVALVNGVYKLTSVTDLDPDAGGPLTATTTSYTYDPTTHQMTRMTDGEGGFTDFTYTSRRLTGITYPDGGVEEIDAVQTRALGTGTSPTNLAPSFSGWTRQARVRDSNGGETVSVRDRFGYPIRVIDGSGHVTRYERNDDGLVLKETGGDADDFGPLGPLVNKYEYDAKGNVTRHTLPGGAKRTWTYNTSFGVPTSYTDELGRVTKYTLDAAGNVLCSQLIVGAEDTGFTYSSSTGQVTGDTDDIFHSYLYTTADDNTLVGLVKKAYDPLDRVTQYSYFTAADQATYPNTKGLLKQVTLPAVGGVTATRLFDYESRGNLDTYTDEENRTTTWEYDALDRLIKETLPDPDTGDAIPAPYRAYTYDKLNRRLTERDEEGNVTNYAYAYITTGLKVTVTEPARDGTSQPTASEYHFDKVGNLVKVIDPLDRETVYKYDLARRLETVTYPDPDQVPGGTDGPLKSPVTLYQYDHLGRLLGTVDATDGANLDPTKFSGLPPTTESGAVSQWNVTTAIGTSEIDLFSIFKDDQDADGQMGYSIVGNTNNAFFDALSITSSNPRKLALDFKSNLTGTDVVTVRATDTSGLSKDHAITVVRTQAQNEIEFRLNTSTTGTQQAPALAATQDGGFVAAWEDTNTGWIMAQRFQDSGSTAGMGGEITVSQGFRVKPAAAVAPNGKMVFAYWRNETGQNKQLYRRTFNADGSAAESEVLVGSYLASQSAPVRPGIAFLSSGGYVIVWRDSTSSDFNVKGQRFDSTGATVGSTFSVNTTTAQIQESPHVAATKDGGFVVVWHGSGTGGDQMGVFSRRYLSDGTSVGLEVPVNVTTNGGQSAAVTPNGGLVIAWSGEGTDAQSGTTDTAGVWVRLRGADGTPASGEILVNQTTTNTQQIPAVAVLPDGGFVVAWQLNAGPSTDVYARRFAANGTPIENEMVVNTTATGTQISAAVAVTARGAVIVGWSGQGNANANSSGDTSGIFGRLLTAYEPGASLGGPFRALSVVPGETVVGPVRHLVATFSEPVSTVNLSTDDFFVVGPTAAIDVTSVALLSATQVLVTLDKELYAKGTYEVTVKSDVRKGTGQLSDRLDQDGDGTPGEATDDKFLPSFHIISGAEAAPQATTGNDEIVLNDSDDDDENPVTVINLTQHFTDANQPGSALKYSVEDVSTSGLLDSVELKGAMLTLRYSRGYTSPSPTTVTVRATDKSSRSTTKTINVTRTVGMTWGVNYDAGPARFRASGISVETAKQGWFDRAIVTFTGPVDSVDDVTLTAPNGNTYSMGKKQISNRQFLLTAGQEFRDPGRYQINVSTATYKYNTNVRLNQDDDGRSSVIQTSVERHEDEFNYSFSLQSGDDALEEFGPTGFPAQKVDALGNITSYTYDKAGNILSMTDPLGRVSRYDYDPLGRLIRERKPYVNPNGHVTIDDGDPAFSTPLGSWTLDATQGNGGDNRFVAGSGSVTAKAEWAFAVEPGKQYEVVATWPKDIDQATDAPFRVYDGNSTTGTLFSTARVDQKKDPQGHSTFGASWQLLGYVRPGGSTLTVQLANDSNGYVTADAVRIIEASFTEYTYDKLDNVTLVSDATGETKYVYDERSRLTEVWRANPTTGVASNAYKTTYEYDKASQLTKVIDALGAQTKYDYDRLGRVTKVSQPDPVTGAVSTTLFTTYKYDQVGNLTEITEPSLGTPWGSPVTTYEYDDHDSLIKITKADPDGTGPLARPFTTYTYDDADRLTRQTDPLTRVTDYKYDELDQLIEIQGADPDVLGGTNRPVATYGYDRRGRRTRVTDPLGNATYFSYDALDRLRYVTDAIGGIAATLYDAAGQVSGEVDQLGRLTAYGYDPQGNLSSVTLPDPDGAVAQYTSPVTTFAYDSLGNRTRQTDPRGHVTSYAYDRQNRLVTETRPDPDGSGTGDPSPVISYAYDAVGRLFTLEESLTSSTSRKWKREYDKLGRLTKLTQPNAATGLDTGPFTVYGYDAVSRLTQITEPDPDGALTEYVSPVTNYEYDALSRHTKTLQPDPDGAGGPLGRPVWVWEYDLAGNHVLLKSPDPSDTTHVGTAVIETALVYDHLDRVKSETRNDPDGADLLTAQTTSYAYDISGNLIRVTEPDPDGSTATLSSPISYRAYDVLGRVVTTLDEREGVTRYQYDGVGNVVSLSDPVLNVTTFSYDRLDRVVAEANALGNARRFAYDANSNLTKRIDRNGRVMTYTLDPLNRRTKEEWFANVADVTPDRTIAWDFDLADQLEGVTDRDAGNAPLAADYTYTRDRQGNLELEKADLAGMGGTQHVFLRHVYDDLARRKESKISTGAAENGLRDYVNTFKYDTLSRLTSIRQEAQGSGSGYNDQIGEKRADFVYNALGQTQQITRYKDTDGLATNKASTSLFVHDKFGRVTSLDHDQPGGTQIAGYTWGYDHLNRVTSFNASTELAGENYDAEDATYNYDAADQLVSADRSATDENYVHDLNGNRRAIGAVNVVVQANNQRHRDGTYEFHYDNEGNLTEQVTLVSGAATGATKVYEYDHRNRLTRVTDKSLYTGGVTNWVIEYTYDAFDRLVKRAKDSTSPFTMTDAVVEQMVYDGRNVVLRYDGAGALQNRYLHGQAVDQVLAEEQLANGLATANRTYWTLADPLGTIRDIANNIGVMKDHLAYDAFGKVLTEESTTINVPFGFTGFWHDRDTGLSFSDTRQYNASLGRWMEEDWIGFAGGDTNLSRYVGNSPTNYTDPTGLVKQDELDTYFELLFGEDGKKLQKAFEEAGGKITVETVWFGDSDYDRWGPGGLRIAIDPDLDPATAAVALMSRLRDAINAMRDHLVANPGNATECEIELMREAYKQAIAEASAAAAMLAQLYLAAISIANEGVDFVITVNDVAEGDVYAAIGFLPFLPTGLAKGGRVFLRIGGTTSELDINKLIKLAERLNITKAEDFAKLMQARKTLAANMRIAGLTKELGEDLHHIVAQGANCDAAKKAREILAKFKIDVNSAYNGVFLPSKFHDRIHTKRYYQAVYDRLRKAKTAERAREILNEIATDLKAGKVPYQ